jgi:hypothetical protein
LKESFAGVANRGSMPDLTAKRTLVKSPPELWEELSEVDRLATHLEAFGEIKITKLEPEHTVAWEGEHASGTVSIEPSGWWTKVVLTAELVEEAAEPTAPLPEPPVVAEESVADEPLVVEEPQSEVPAIEGPRPGFWTRLFRRRAVSATGGQVTEPEPVADVEYAPGAGTVLTLPPPGGQSQDSPPETAAVPEPDPTQLDADRAQAALDQALDALGAAHHRPFSRG